MKATLVLRALTLWIDTLFFWLIMGALTIGTAVSILQWLKVI